MIMCIFFQAVTKPEAKRKEACTRIRLKIFPYFLKARESGNAVPYNVLVSSSAKYQHICPHKSMDESFKDYSEFRILRLTFYRKQPQNAELGISSKIYIQFI